MEMVTGGQQTSARAGHRTLLTLLAIVVVAGLGALGALETLNRIAWRCSSVQDTEPLDSWIGSDAQ